MAVKVLTKIEVCVFKFNTEIFESQALFNVHPANQI